MTASNDNARLQELQNEIEVMKKILSQIKNKNTEKAKDLQERIEENILSINRIRENAKKLKNKFSEINVSEEMENSNGLFESLMTNAIHQAFHFIILAAGKPQLYDLDNDELIREGFTLQDIEYREALAWIEEDDDEFYQPEIIQQGTRTMYIGPYTSNFVGGVLGINMRNIRKCFDKSKEMDEASIKQAFALYKNKQKLTQNTQWEEPTIEELDHLAQELERTL